MAKTMVITALRDDYFSGIFCKSEIEKNYEKTTLSQNEDAAVQLR